MILFLDYKNRNWLPRANDEMILDTMLDELYSGRLIEGFRQKRYGKYLSFKSSIWFFRGLYDEHKALLLDVVEIFFPRLVFTPKEITNKYSQEFYMWLVIETILHIVWYQNMAKSGQKGYEKEEKKFKKALDKVREYAKNDKDLMRNFCFPAHQNEIIRNLEDFFIKNNREHQIKKIIPIIKIHFGIEKLTITKHKVLEQQTKELQKIFHGYLWKIEI